jgi:hypothetical protein
MRTGEGIESSEDNLPATHRANKALPTVSQLVKAPHAQPKFNFMERSPKLRPSLSLD